MASRLFINGRFLTQQTTGVQSFARSICAELETVTDFTLLVPDNARLLNAEFSDRIFRTGKLRGHLWEQLHLPLFLRKHRGSVLLNLCNTGPAFNHNQVVTIHDLAFLKNPSWFHPLFARYYSWLIPRLAANSKAILTVSESVKQELLDAFRIDKSKIHVAGNKIHPGLLLAKPAAPVVTGIKANHYFLMVGSADPRKNFAMAEQLFIEKFPDIQLVIAGGRHRSFQVNGPSAQASNIIRTGYTDDSALKWLYENALGFINPSMYEGFGIPNLEAFAFGCPVICSDLPVFREVCNGAAFYFDPARPASLLDAVQNCLHDKQQADENISSGKAIFTSFQNKTRSQILLKALAL